MVSCGSLLMSALVAMVVVAVVESGPGDEKLASCCKSVNSKEITDPITGYMLQKRNLPCVRAVIFQTEKGLFCSQFNAPWVLPKIREFENAKATATPSAKAPSSTLSLLSIITSTASPSSPSAPFASEMPSGESASENAE